MNKYLKIVIILCVITTSVIVCLYSFSSRKSNVKNEFNRTFNDPEVVIKGILPLEDRYSIGDLTQNSIILYKVSQPAIIMRINTNLSKIVRDTLPFLKAKERLKGVQTLTFFNSNIYWFDGLNATVNRLNFNPKEVISNKLDSNFFNVADVINKDVFIFQSKKILKGDMRRVLKKVDLKGHLRQSYILEKQTDGYFCTDGQFKYDRKTNLLVYMFYYRGEFICLDSNLKMVYAKKTIDTVKNAKLETTLIKEKINGNYVDKVVTTKPPQFINKRLCLSDDYIYIQSHLIGDNEDKNIFNKSEVFDVYLLKNGKYVYSFYLPKLKGQKIREFKIYKNMLIGLYKDNLVVYNLPFT